LKKKLKFPKNLKIETKNENLAIKKFDKNSKLKKKYEPKKKIIL